MEKRRWIIDRRTEVSGRSGSVLDGKRVIATVPFQALMSQPERVTIRCGNYRARWRRPTFRGSEIEPPSPETRRSLQGIETHVDVALRKVSVWGDNVGSRAG